MRPIVQDGLETRVGMDRRRRTQRVHLSSDQKRNDPFKMPSQTLAENGLSRGPLPYSARRDDALEWFWSLQAESPHPPWWSEESEPLPTESADHRICPPEYRPTLERRAVILSGRRPSR